VNLLKLARGKKGAEKRAAGWVGVRPAVKLSTTILSGSKSLNLVKKLEEQSGDGLGLLGCTQCPAPSKKNGICLPR